MTTLLPLGDLRRSWEDWTDRSGQGWVARHERDAPAYGFERSTTDGILTIVIHFWDNPWNAGPCSLGFTCLLVKKALGFRYPAGATITETIPGGFSRQFLTSHHRHQYLTAMRADLPGFWKREGGDWASHLLRRFL